MIGRDWVVFGRNVVAAQRVPSPNLTSTCLVNPPAPPGPHSLFILLIHFYSYLFVIHFHSSIFTTYPSASSAQSLLLHLLTPHPPSHSSISSTAENVESWFERLRQAEKELSGLITHKFDEAVKREDMASVDRFFKLFPLLNKHQEGLRKFTTYLCAKVRQGMREGRDEGGRHLWK